MNVSTLTALTILAGVLALGEFGSAVMIWLEHSGPGAGVLLAVFFGGVLLAGRLAAASRARHRRHVLVGLLCLFEVVWFPCWARHNAGTGFSRPLSASSHWRV